MSTLARGTDTKMHLFARWSNALEDVYIDVSNITDRSIDITLTDNEDSNSGTYAIGDMLYLPNGTWVLVEIAPDDETLRAWDMNRSPNAVLARYF